ncbi:L-seryl-tRNA(Sec) selenium transferase [Acidimicrobiaceae bacterium]|nr:L-seryl-tRNA(Sec) selenium transferase [Acidimicrobiaceae bacterium]
MSFQRLFADRFKAMNRVSVDTAGRPPSVDALARELAIRHSLPHALLVDFARRAIATAASSLPSTTTQVKDYADQLAAEFSQSLLREVINATGVLLHTNLGRAPVEMKSTDRASNLELNMDTGERGSRQSTVGKLLALLCGAESAIVVNNNAAAVLLVVAALANSRDVAVSRGESVEIGGNFRIPEVTEQSGARLVDVGTTNRTRLRDYKKAIDKRDNDIALVLKVHPSNYRVSGFVEDTPVRELATLPVPVVADIGSGLIDNTCPWLEGRAPAWLANEPAARQTLSDGAALVMFSGDKLFGGPQCGVIAGRADLVEACAQHPLARALRPGSLTMISMQSLALSYLARTATSEIAFWKMASISVAELQLRAKKIISAAHIGEVCSLDSIPGAGSAPGATISSAGVVVAGDHLAKLRNRELPIVARVKDSKTYFDLRTVRNEDDHLLIEALRSLVE